MIPETKPCKQCRRPMVRKPSHNDLNWSQKETCDTNCRAKYYQRHGGRGVPYDEWEPSEAEAAEMERRKLECRMREVGHLQTCEREDG